MEMHNQLNRGRGKREQEERKKRVVFFKILGECMLPSLDGNRGI